MKEVRDGGAVERTLNREVLRAVQTPQVFDAELLKAALQAALEREDFVTDDCSAVEHLGKVVFLVDGDRREHQDHNPGGHGCGRGNSGGKRGVSAWGCALGTAMTCIV